jgi:hypothetical protein
MIENNIIAILGYIHQYDSEFEKHDHKVVPEMITDLVEQSIILKQNEGFQIEDFFKLSITEEAYIFIIQVDYKVTTGRYTEITSEFQIFGVKTLNSSYGNLMIRPETFTDKVTDLFLHQDRDFKNYPKFSKKYFFLDDQSGFSEMFATPERLMLIEKYDNLLVEVIGNKLITKFANFLNEDDFVNMIQLLKGI